MIPFTVSYLWLALEASIIQSQSVHSRMRDGQTEGHLRETEKTKDIHRHVRDASHCIACMCVCACLLRRKNDMELESSETPYWIGNTHYYTHFIHHAAHQHQQPYPNKTQILLGKRLRLSYIEFLCSLCIVHVHTG